MSTTATDPRRVVGNKVEAKTCHVGSLAECARRYGANQSTKKLQGTVISSDVVRNKKTNRSSTYPVVVYNLGCGITRNKRLNIGSVKLVAPVAQDEEISVPAEVEDSSPSSPFTTMRTTSIASVVATIATAMSSTTAVEIQQ